MTLHLIHGREYLDRSIIQNPGDDKRLTFVTILLFEFSAVSLKCLISLYFHENFIIFVFAITVPQVILDIVGIDFLKVFPPLLGQLEIKVHLNLGAAATGNDRIVLLVAQPLL